jgi:hypothetical protein
MRHPRPNQTSDPTQDADRAGCDEEMCGCVGRSDGSTRHPHSAGRAYFDRKVAEGKTKKAALRALKRQISNAVYRQLVVDARNSD